MNNNYKPEMFQLQKFFKQRKLFYNVFPAFKKESEIVENQLEQLGQSAPFQITGRIRHNLMLWFIRNMKNQSNVHEILDFIPDSELIPDNGSLLTKREYSLRYGIVLDCVPTSKTNEKLFRMVANMHGLGGGELSAIQIMHLFLADGYKVIFHPTRSIHPQLLKLFNKHIQISTPIDITTKKSHSSILMIYSNDFVYKLSTHKEVLLKLLNNSDYNVCCLNFVMGESWQPWFSSKINKYLFLNKTKETEFVNRLKNRKLPINNTFSMAPPINITSFVQIQPNYNKINFVRTGRCYGKYDEDVYLRMIKNWQTFFPQANFVFMPAPNKIRNMYNNNKLFRFYNWNKTSVENVLQQGSVFHYHLPRKMCDQGPRVIVEAQLAGIPCIAPPRDGCYDRITMDTGWFAETEKEYNDVIAEIKNNPNIVKEKGLKAKERAKKLFNPLNWLKEIKGESK